MCEILVLLIMKNEWLITTSLASLLSYHLSHARDLGLKIYVLKCNLVLPFINNDKIIIKKIGNQLNPKEIKVLRKIIVSV